MNAVTLPSWCRAIRAENPGPMTLAGTNTYIVRTAGGNVVIDPGPAMEEHLADVAADGPVALTVLTHHHGDHSGGAHRFHELTGAPVLARDPALCRGGGVLPPDGARLDMPGPALRIVDTPGHTADSVSIVAEVASDDADNVDEAGPERAVLFSGDTVLGRGTTVVAQPDGDLAAYLQSLDRLHAGVAEGCLLLPGHGPAREDAAAVIAEYIEHRRQRLDQVRAALAGGARTAADVVDVVYADVDSSVLPAAEQTVQAALDYLNGPGDASARRRA